MQVIVTTAPGARAMRLLLEPLAVEHAEAMFEVLSDPETHRYLDHPPPASVEALRKTYARLQSRKSPDGSQLWLNWVIRETHLPPVGYVQATVLATKSAWIAYAFSSSHWGLGLAHAATHAMLEHLRTEYGVRRFLATVEKENLRSIRLLERLHFKPATGEAEVHGLAPTERLFVR